MLEDTALINKTTEPTVKQRYPAIGNDANVLADIYKDEINIAIWQRQLPLSLQQSVGNFIQDNPHFARSMTVSPSSAYDSLSLALGTPALDDLAYNIKELVDMFCCLFELERVGLRLAVLDSAMCPRFHVDNVPCRLITTFQGVATQWLPHEIINRSKLGAGSEGKPDDVSGLFEDTSNIQHLDTGAVALMKGEAWEGNEGAGLVHRSPQVDADHRRLVLTLDFGY